MDRPEVEPAAGRLRPYVPRVVLAQLAAGEGALTQTVDGTVVFVDISGFTKLSERLARRGREGAEHLADAIGGCFSSLLALAYANGGSLLKFGGDALLLLFDGPGHVERSVRSAAGMRQTLRDVGRIDAGGAKVTLRMSVGVHTGEFHLFLVGASHREFLVAGPAASRVVEMEGAADAGEILLSPETCQHLPASCVGQPKGPGRLLVRAPAGATLAPAEPDWAVDDDAIASCLSTGLRSHVFAGRQPPEHRTVTVAFIHFLGTDDLIARQGPGAAAAALQALVATIQAAADEYEVCFMASDVDADGGKVLLAAGAPRVLGDDEERMLLALRRIVEADLPLPVHVGVNRGPVFAGDVGPHYRRTYTTMGDATNLAARLMAKAPPGEIYATAGVLDRSATRFQLREIEPFMVKGKSRPIQAWSVGPVAGARSSGESDAADVPLLGRAPEVAAIEAAVASAAEGRGRLIEIVGERGIGKTRLVEELRSRAAISRRIEAHCEAYTSSSPYATWSLLLRRLVDATPDTPDDEILERLARDASAKPDLLPYLPLIAVAAGVAAPATPEVDQLADEFRQAKLHEVVGDFLRIHHETPTIVEIEHAQHMDAASSDLLAAVADGLHDSRWIVVLTRRDGDTGFEAPDGPAVVRLTPGPLGADDTVELARCLTRRTPLPPHALEAAAERSGGNASFLRDLLRATMDGVETLPDSIEAAALARIDRLPPADRAVVRRASVLGSSFTVEELEDVLGDELEPPDEEGWLRLHPFLIRDGASVRFERTAVREAAYSGLPFRLRRELHAIAGHRIERRLWPAVDEAADILSLHFLLAGNHEMAWRYARVAAERARDAFAYSTAVVLYRRALEASRQVSVPPDDLVDIWEGLATAYERLGDPAAATEAYAAAGRLLDDRPRHALLLQRRALMTMDAGGTPQAVRCANRGLRLLEGVAGREAAAARALLIATLASIRQRQGRTNEAIGLCRRAIREARQSGEERALARASSVLDWALVESGRPAEATHAGTSLDIYRRLGDLYNESIVLNNLGGFAYREGRWDDAVGLWAASVEASRRCGDVTGVAMAEGNIGELRSDQGRLEEGEDAIRSALQVFEGIGNEYGAAYFTTMLGRLTVRAHRFEESEGLFGHALERFARMRSGQNAGMVEAFLCERLAVAGEHADAYDRAERLLDSGTAGPRFVPLLQRIRAAGLTAAGRPDEAEDALRDALADSRATDDLFETAASLHEIAMLDRASEAERAECDELLDRLGVVRVVTSLLGAQLPAASS